MYITSNLCGEVRSQTGTRDFQVFLDMVYDHVIGSDHVIFVLVFTLI